MRNYKRRRTPGLRSVSMLRVSFDAYTLKGQEAGKYKDETDINNIDYAGYIVNKLLSDADNAAFLAKVESFGIKLNG